MDVIAGIIVGLAVGWLIADEYHRRTRRGALKMVKVGDIWWIYVKGTGWVDTVPVKTLGERVRLRPGGLLSDDDPGSVD